MGGLVRMPQVWFYSLAAVYPELLALHLKALEFRRQLAHAWMVSVCPHSSGGATIFQILPEQVKDAEVQAADLSSLQHDLLTIADSLPLCIRQSAQRLLAGR